jgi:hypothetical protein
MNLSCEKDQDLLEIHPEGGFRKVFTWRSIQKEEGFLEMIIHPEGGRSLSGNPSRRRRVFTWKSIQKEEGLYLEIHPEGGRSLPGNPSRRRKVFTWKSIQKEEGLYLEIHPDGGRSLPGDPSRRRTVFTWKSIHGHVVQEWMDTVQHLSFHFWLKKNFLLISFLLSWKMTNVYTD